MITMVRIVVPGVLGLVAVSRLPDALLTTASIATIAATAAIAVTADNHALRDPSTFTS